MSRLDETAGGARDPRMSGPDLSLDEPSSEIDLRAIGAALRRRRRTYVVPTIVAFVAVGLYVNVATRRYTAQTQILLENQETFFTRPDRVSLPAETASQLDEAAVASQVQLIGSPDIARRAIRQLRLAGNDEFDPNAHPNPLLRALLLAGLVADPSRDGAEARMAETFAQRLTVFSPPKTRVVTIEFTSRDPALAARGANTVAELYIKEQSAAKRAQAQAAAEALAAQIAQLRGKLAHADAERESYRASSGLLAGNNNLTISGQQLADINGDLSRARAVQADAQAKATLIRELLRTGRATEVTEVTNNDIVRRTWDQRTTAQAQLALEARTLLPAHPRIKELTAQVAQYDAALKNAARQAATTLENEATIAGQRVANLETVLGQQKKAVGVANGDEVHLRALERVAQSLKDQLESSTTKYEEAMARQSSTATPADARVISRAVEPQQPSYPKKVPFTVFGTVATFVFAFGYVVASELMSGRAQPGVVEAPLPAEAPPPSKAPTPAEAPVPIRNEEAPRVSLLRRRLLRAASARSVDVVEIEPAAVPLPASPAVPSAAFRTAFAAPRRLLAAAAGRAASVVASLKEFGRSAADTARHDAHRIDGGIGWDLLPSQPAGKGPSVVAPPRDNVALIAERIVAAHVPGRGLHIVGTSIGGDAASTERLIALGRALAEKGRSLVVDLGTTPLKLAALADSEDGHGRIMGLAGLSELLAGNSSFAEVIHRDCASRLHFIPTGLLDADFRDFDLILDALSETYDFILMLTPAFPQSEIAKVMAPYADFVVLTAAVTPDRDQLNGVKAEMLEAGARDVLVAETWTGFADDAVPQVA